MNANTPDFSHLKKLEVSKDATAECELPELSVPDGSEPTYLVVVHAGEPNRPYFNALSRKTIKNARKIRGGKRTAEVFSDNREHDRELYPKFVVKGWGNVFDVTDQPVAFNRENCETLIDALPNHIFDRARDFASEIENFIADEDESPVTTADAVDLGESSPTN